MCRAEGPNMVNGIFVVDEKRRLGVVKTLTQSQTA